MTLEPASMIPGNHLSSPSALGRAGIEFQSLKAGKVSALSGPANPSGSSNAKLRKAAGEFESILLESLWRSMKETFASPDDDSDPILQSFDDWSIRAMSSAVGQAGGLGIKNMIVRYLEPRITGGAPPASASAPQI